MNITVTVELKSMAAHITSVLNWSSPIILLLHRCTRSWAFLKGNKLAQSGMSQ